MGALLHQAKFFDLPFDVGALCYVKHVYAESCFTVLPNLIIQDTSESDISSSDVQQDEGRKRANVYRWKLDEYFPAPTAATPREADAKTLRQAAGT
jgi:hypothetical protein